MPFWRTRSPTEPLGLDPREQCLRPDAGHLRPCHGAVFDVIHPTTFGHALLADAVFAQVVPEPASYLLLGSGLLLLMWLRRQPQATPARAPLLV